MTKPTIIQNTQALIHSVLELVDAKAEIDVLEPGDPGSDTYLFQLRLATEQLPAITGRAGSTWQLLRAFVRLAGAHHHMSFEIGIVDPPDSTWRVGVPAKSLRMPVKMLRTLRDEAQTTKSVIKGEAIALLQTP